MKFQLPVHNMSQFGLYTLNVALDSYSEQNNLLMDGGFKFADFFLCYVRLYLRYALKISLLL